MGKIIKLNLLKFIFISDLNNKVKLYKNENINGKEKLPILNALVQLAVNKKQYKRICKTQLKFKTNYSKFKFIIFIFIR
tara:strand:+ start:4047 stop:4283 length:237 start_codon:yes stop_codon:yes gene_type:complete